MREGIVIIVRRADRFLVIQRAAHILAGGAWCFVGGGLEPGESQEAGVVREFFEEVGGRVRPVRKVWMCENEARDGGRLRLHWWLAELVGAETADDGSPQRERVETGEHGEMGEKGQRGERGAAEWADGSGPIRARSASACGAPIRARSASEWVELVANPAEVADMRWLTAEEMLALPGLLETNCEFLRVLDLKQLETWTEAIP